jgi:hypothetical protein
MPTVPRRDPASTVDQQPLQAPTVTLGSPTEETFGGGASAQRLQQAQAGLGDAGVKLIAQMQEDADRALAQEFDARAVAKKNEIMFTVKKDYRGKNAAQAPEFYNSEWNKFIESERENMPNSRVVGLTAKRYNTYFNQINSQSQTHMFAEMEQYVTDITATNIEASTDDSAKNWGNREIEVDSIAKIEASAANLAQHKGWDPKTEKVYLDAQMNNFHKRQIEQRLVDGFGEEAEEYFKRNKGGMDSGEAKTYKSFIATEKNRIAQEQKNAKQIQYDEVNRNFTLESFKGNATLSEAQRLFQNDEMSESDFKAWENKLTSSDFQSLRRRLRIADPSEAPITTALVTSSSIFNEIREAQLLGTESAGALDRKIRDNSNQLTQEDAEFLMNNNKQTEGGKRLYTQAQSIRSWGEQYLKTGLTGLEPVIENVKTGNLLGAGVKATQAFTTEAQKKEQIEDLVKEFQNRVAKENAVGERVDEIAKEVKVEAIKREDPTIGSMQNMADVIVDINGKVKNLFLEPFKGDKPKSQYTLTRNNGELSKPEPKKEKKK